LPEKPATDEEIKPRTRQGADAETVGINCRNSHMMYKELQGNMRMKRRIRKVMCICLVLLALCVNCLPVQAGVLEITSPSAILMEASTGQVIFEQNADERRSPASITKIMTLLLAFEAIEAGKADFKDDVITSEYASSMGGSQVFLAQGETQTLKTMIKCIVIASGNDASVAVAEHIAGSESAFVDMMNAKAKELGMENTHFEDCCGLTDSDNHYSSARDVAIMSRELILNYPEIYEYTQIWMEDITHVTKQGSSLFTLSSTNKLLKQYPYTTGLKTGSTSKAKFCLSATAHKDDMDMIAVVLGAEEGKVRFSEAQTLLTYGFSICDLYIDEEPEKLSPLVLEGGLKDTVELLYKEDFKYLDTKGNNLDSVQKFIELPAVAQAPVNAGEVAGYAIYSLEGKELGRVPIIYGETVEKAGYGDYFLRILKEFLL